MCYRYDLTLGLPHTNHRGLSEPLLMQHAGHFQWASIAQAANAPLARLRTLIGGEVYAAFYYIETIIPDDAPLESCGLDDTLRFCVRLRAFKNIALEGRLVFGHRERMGDEAVIAAALNAGADRVPFPYIRFGNIFITPVTGNSVLRVAPPAGVDFSALPVLANDDNPYHLTQAASRGEGLGVLDSNWEPAATATYVHALDVDRDTNGAGLVYFANYVSFMESAERLALEQLDVPSGRDVLAGRSLRHRRIAYYGNADVSDTIAVRSEVYRRRGDASTLGFRFAIERLDDHQNICLSEAIKTLPIPE